MGESHLSDTLLVVFHVLVRCVTEVQIEPKNFFIERTNYDIVTIGMDV